jgi:hypothetical protein
MAALVRLACSYAFYAFPTVNRPTANLSSGLQRAAASYQQRSVGEAFSLDDRPPPAEKAAPTKKISPYLEKNKKKSSLIFRLDFFLTDERRR